MTVFRLGIYFYLLTFLVLTTQAYGASKNDKSEAAAVVTTTVRRPPSRDSHFSLGPSVHVLEGLKGAIGVVGGLGYNYRVSSQVPLYFGMDIGFAQYQVDVVKTVGEGENQQEVPGVETLTSINVLASVYYRFWDDSSSQAHPYFGVSVGTSLIQGDSSIHIGDQALTGKGTQVKLLVLFRPGVEFDLSQRLSLNIEPKFGVFSGHFLFSPQVGIGFSF